MSFDIDEPMGIILTRLCTSMPYDKAASLAALYVSDLRHMQLIVDCMHECGRKPTLFFVGNKIHIYDEVEYCCYHGNIYSYMLTYIDDVLYTIKNQQRLMSVHIKNPQWNLRLCWQFRIYIKVA